MLTFTRNWGEKVRDDTPFLLSQLGKDLEEEYEKIRKEIESGYEKEDALFLLLNFFKKVRRRARERLGGERLRIFEKRLRKSFISLAKSLGAGRKELGSYLKELGIKKEEERYRRAVTTAQLRGRVKPVSSRREIRDSLSFSDLLLLFLLLFLLLLFLFFLQSKSLP